MKMNHIFCIVTLLLLVSCKKDELQTVKIKGKYSVEIPANLTRHNDLNSAASLQYANTANEQYIIVIDETKESFEKAIANSGTTEFSSDFDSYTRLLSESFDSDMETGSTTPLTPATINGLNAKTMAVTTTKDGIPFLWKIAYIEGRNDYYQVLTWTLAAKKEDFAPKMDAMLQSFKEMDKSRK